MEIVGLEKKLSLEEQPGSRATTFGESDADLAYLVPFHGRHRPGQTLPFDLVANYGLATDFVGDEAPQWLIAFHVIKLQTIERSNRAKFGVAFQHEIAEETQVLTTLGRLAEQLAEGRQIVLVRRAIEPGYGKWVFPGGYVDRGEEITLAAIREAREEVGLDVRLDHLVNIYSYAGRAPVIIVYAATKMSGDLAVDDRRGGGIAGAEIDADPHPPSVAATRGPAPIACARRGRSGDGQLQRSGGHGQPDGAVQRRALRAASAGCR